MFGTLPRNDVCTRTFHYENDKFQFTTNGVIIKLMYDELVSKHSFQFYAEEKIYMTIIRNSSSINLDYSNKMENELLGYEAD